MQVGRVRFWFLEATALEEVNAAAFSAALQRLRVGAKNAKMPEPAAEAERLLKAVEQWNGKRMAQVEQLLKTAPTRGMELLRQTSVLLKGDPLAEPFAKREAEAAKDRELQKQLALDRQFEGMAAIYRKEAGRFRRAEDPKAVALRQQFEATLDAFIKANANTVAADRAADMKKELSGFCSRPQAPR